MNISDDSVNALLDSLLELHPKKIDLSLDRSFALLNKLGNPQDKIENIIHFAGTNGKFSTLNFVKEILKYNQKSINAYISPHLVKFNERFEIQDQIISNETLHKTLSDVKDTNNLDPITFFEITSAGFFKLAAEHSSDYTLLETGLGGRLDSSNVMTPLISVIASISHDHHDFLGDTIEKIAAEKAGIIKKNVPVVIGYQPFNEARRVLLEYAESIEAPTFMYDQDYTMNKDGDHLVYEDEKHKIRFENLSHQGEFQIKNLGLAIATCFQLEDINVHSFLENNLHQKVYFPGRFEKLENNTLNNLISEQNELYLDGSHNPDAAANINEALRFLTEKKLCIVIGMLNTKNPAEYIQQFSDIESIHTISIPGEENTLDSLTLKDIVQDQCQNTYASENIESSIKDIASKNPDARILICGSLYLAGQVLKNN